LLIRVNIDEQSGQKFPDIVSLAPKPTRQIGNCLACSQKYATPFLLNNLLLIGEAEHCRPIRDLIFTNQHKFLEMAECK